MLDVTQPPFPVPQTRKEMLDTARTNQAGARDSFEQFRVMIDPTIIKGQNPRDRLPPPTSAQHARDRASQHPASALLFHRCTDMTSVHPPSGCRPSTDAGRAPGRPAEARQRVLSVHLAPDSEEGA
jgi:hypothetical protein